MTDREEFFTKLTALAGMVSNFALTPTIVALYDQSLSPLGYEPLSRALDQIIMNRSSRDPFPSISEIRKVVEPEVSERDDAVTVSSLIYKAVAKVGPYQAALAREAIGEIGWLIVEREGGWMAVCESVTFDNAGMYKAQWRDMALSIINRSKAGLSGPPQLPKLSKQQNQEIDHRKSVMKQLEQMRNGVEPEKQKQDSLFKPLGAE